MIIIRKVLDIGVAMGWGLTMSALLTCSGAIALFLGVKGEYLGHVFMTLNGNPQFAERTVPGE